MHFATCDGLIGLGSAMNLLGPGTPKYGSSIIIGTGALSGTLGNSRLGSSNIILPVGCGMDDPITAI